VRNEVAMDQLIPFHMPNKKSGVRKLTTSFLKPNKKKIGCINKLVKRCLMYKPQIELSATIIFTNEVLTLPDIQQHSSIWITQICNSQCLLLSH
jgi:hypothetical protein